MVPEITTFSESKKFIGEAFRMLFNKPSTLLIGAPFIFGMGQSTTLFSIYFCLAAFGLFRGIYEANFITTFFDTIEPPLSRIDQRDCVFVCV